MLPVCSALLGWRRLWQAVQGLDFTYSRGRLPLIPAAGALSLLAVRPNPSDDPKNDAKNALCRLWPSTFAAVPVGARRIMKVDNFYVVLQVKAYHLTPPDSPYLDSMTVQVEFRNTDPRQTEGSSK